MGWDVIKINQSIISPHIFLKLKNGNFNAFSIEITILNPLLLSQPQELFSGPRLFHSCLYTFSCKIGWFILWHVNSCWIINVEVFFSKQLHGFKYKI